MAVYVYPEQFEQCVALLTQRLQTIASRADVADEDCADLQATLAALPAVSRDRASVMLQGVRAQTGDPCMAFAASYVLFRSVSQRALPRWHLITGDMAQGH